MTKAVLIIAHPDDDAAFACRLQMAMPFIWRVVCVHTDMDSDRYADLCKWQRFIGGDPNPVALGIPEGEDFDAKLLVNHLAGASLVVSHNAVGEYGHPDHKRIHHKVKSILGNRQFWTFGYGLPNPDLTLQGPSLHEKIGQTYESEGWITTCFNSTVQTFNFETPDDGLPT